MGLARFTVLSLVSAAALFASRASAQVDVAATPPPPTNQPAPEAEEPAAKPEEEKEQKEEPWRLVGDLPGTGIHVNGWVDMGITANGDRPHSRYNGTLAPNDRNEFQFNQTYLVMEKSLKPEEHCWDLGGRVDLLYGSDYIYGISTGFETHPDGSQKWDSHFQYGLIMPQAYGEVAYGDLSLKLGRFYTNIGYESLMAPNNFFYSMNYALRYAEPTTHTGGLFTWKATDEWALFGGGVNGQDRTDGLTDSLAALTGFAYTPKDEKYSLNFAIMTGGLEPTNVPTVFAPRTYFSTYYTYNFSERFQSVTQWDAGWQQNFDLEDHTADFWSFTQYLFYTINPCWKAGLRYDMFVDDQGTRLGGLRYGGLPGGNPLPLPSGNAGTVQAITAGLNYTPNANFRLRPELRWDWFGGQGIPLFDDRQKDGQFTAAVDMIVLF
ncbi:MAG: outer membrane beta-barrel protein [Pirellulales bacterium]